MSLRVIRNRERQKSRKHQTNNNNNQLEVTIPEITARKRVLVRYKSCPDLRSVPRASVRVSQSKSETDLKQLKEEANTKQNFFSNAKSEVCLKTISVHNTMQAYSPSSSSTPHHYYLASRQHHQQPTSTTSASIVDRSYKRRMSDKSDISSPVSGCTTFSDSPTNFNNAVYGSAIHIPIVGYEVMEERARFTVFKLRVENPFTNDCWLVLRRYTDFHRLYTKLKAGFPKLNLSLPKKKVFGDNFNNAFLDTRVQGLQQFVNAVMSNENLRSCPCVREFFCLDEPPTYSESMEECRAIFEAQEETITHLKHQLSNKDILLLNMEQKLTATLKALQDHLAQCSQQSPIYDKTDITNNNVN